MKDNKALILTGPGGSGKSTLAKLLKRNFDYTVINGDELDTEFFPEGGQWLPENESKRKRAHNKILAEAKKEFDSGKNVVIDYIIFGEYKNFFKKFKNEFGEKLQIRVLFPSEEETIARDKERQCWTTGAEKIRKVRTELLNIKNEIGKDNFVDTSNQTPEETIETLNID